MTASGEPLRGRKLGDRRVRVDRPEAPYFRYVGTDTVTVKPRAVAPSTGAGRAVALVRRLVIGRPLATEQEMDERLSKRKALAIFSSDAISSSAYASEEILRMLVVATIPAQVAQQVYGRDSVGFFAFQAFTALILFLAANTSFNAFPRLAAILGTDGFMPRQFAYRGDRLAFSRGIIGLGAIACAILVVFGGDTHAIIPLYAVGVFIDFSISQAGMMRHWLTTRASGWPRRLAINSVGLAMAATVGVVVIVAKAPLSLLVLVLIPLLVSGMLLIGAHYARVERELRVTDERAPGETLPRRTRSIVPVPDLNRAVDQAMDVARSLSADVTAIHVTDDLESAARLRDRFLERYPSVRFVVVESPYRQLVGPLVAYLDRMSPDPDSLTHVIVPEYVVRHWWEEWLHNDAARRLRRALLGRPNTVVTGIAYRRER